ncbi:DUF4157 domain-containing protein [Streptomyces olivaceus]|nr:DUF4157 domain-containing protein [Streptomyces olivaceus]MBZ6168378.1 DUF4157 domain-containing protein [Streptomyces olivaceus]
MSSPSRPLPESLRAAAEPFFGNRNFSTTQVHDNPVAQRATAALGAQAMTVGNHIFAPPSVIGDMRVMGHELSHVNENLGGTTETGTDMGAGLTVTRPEQHSEQKADRDGVFFAAGAATAPSVAVQRSASRSAGPSTGTAGGAAAGQHTVQRAPSGYADYMGYSDEYVDPMILDSEPPRRPSSRRPSVGPSSYVTTSSHQDMGWDDGRGRASSRAPFERSRRSSQAPAHSRDVDMEMDLDWEDRRSTEGYRGRSSRRPGISRTSSQAPDHAYADMDLDGPQYVASDPRRSYADGGQGSLRRSRSSHRSSESSRYSRPQGVQKNYQPASNTTATLLSIGSRVMRDVHARLSHGAANQIRSASAAGGGLQHLLNTVRDPQYRQPATSFQHSLGQTAAAADALGVGNCGEHAALTFCLLNRERLPGGVHIWFVSLSIDHAFVAVGRRNTPERIVVLDPWQNGATPRMAPDFNFPFLVDGRVTSEAQEFPADRRDYLALGRQTVDIDDMQQTMDTTAPAIDPREYAGQSHMWDHAMPSAPSSSQPRLRRRPRQRDMSDRLDRYLSEGRYDLGDGYA